MRALLLSLCGALGGATAATSQDTVGSTRAAPRALAIEGGRLLVEGEVLASHLAVRVSRLSPRGSLEFAAATFPEAFDDGVVIAIMDFDLSSAFAVGNGVWLAPRLGVSRLLAAGQYGSDATGGYNVGGGLIVRVGPGTGLRADYTFRRFGVEQFGFFEGPTASSVSAGFVLLR
jgi:hypothetical protein